jgi:hypothetical protein
MIWMTLKRLPLRGRFDALKVQVTTPSAPAGIEAVLDKIGVGTRREKYV